MKKTLRVAWASLLISLIVLGMKTAAYWLTGSVALYSDAIETVINVVTAATALLALWYSARPADTNHPYGHYKAEYLSAVVEGMLVLATSVMICSAAWDGWQQPPVLHAPLLGIGVNAAAGMVNLLWALVLLREGRISKSPALVAGGRHVMTDVWTTGAVLTGFGLVPLTGWTWLDPLVAIFIALNILRSGYGLLRQSVGGLMDEVTNLGEADAVRRAIVRGGQGAIEAHDVRMRVAGRMTFVDFHLVVPGGFTVDAAHTVCDRIEQSIREAVGEAVISIHVEPAHKTKLLPLRQDVLVLS